MIRFQLWWIIVFLLTLGFQASEAATIRVCYETWKPYIFADDQGHVSGIDHDLLAAAARDLGYEVKYVEQPFKRCVAGLRSGRMDIVLSVSRGKQGILDSAVVTAYWTLAAIVRLDSPLADPISLKKLRGKKVLLIDGYRYPPDLYQWFADNTDVFKITYGATSIGLSPFRMIEFKRADVFIEDRSWSRALIAKYKLKLHVLAPPLVVDPSVMGYRKGLAGLRDKIDESLMRRGQSFRDALFMKYTGSPESAFSGAKSALDLLQGR